MIEAVIGSPVFAAHINELMQRLLRVAVLCPGVACHTTVGYMGYQYVGTKMVTPSGLGGLTYVPTNMYAPSTKLCVTIPSIHTSVVDPQRTAAQCSTKLNALSTKSGTVTDNWIPTYREGGSWLWSGDIYHQGPQTRVYDCDLSGVGGGNYDLCCMVCATSYDGTFGYEQDVLPYNAWVMVQDTGVEDEA